MSNVHKIKRKPENIQLNKSTHTHTHTHTHTYIYIYIYTHTVVVKIIGTLVKYVTPFDLLFFFKSQKSNLSLENRNLNGGKYHYEIKVFL